MKDNFSKYKKATAAIIGIVVGIVTIILGIVLSMPDVSTVSSKTFGADFYTESHSAVAYVSWGIKDLVKLVFYVSKCLLISIGLFEVVFFLYKLFSIDDFKTITKGVKTEYEEVKELENELPEI